MADEITPPEPPAPPTPSADDTRWTALDQRISALHDTVQAALTARTTQPTSAPGVAGAVTPQLRASLRQYGMTDADIDANSPLILPYVMALAPELVGMIEQNVSPLREQLSVRDMEDDGDAYPYAKLLRKEIRGLLASAKKDGRPLSQEAAYHTAVSTNQPKVREHDDGQRSTSRGADASATSGLGHRAFASSGQRAAKSEPKTAADLGKMSREDRMKFYESNSDAPIQ